MKIVEVDVHNRLKGKYSNGKFDTIAVAGKDIFLGIDADLQLYGEQLMQNKMKHYPKLIFTQELGTVGHYPEVPLLASKAIAQSGKSQ